MRAKLGLSRSGPILALVALAAAGLAGCDLTNSAAGSETVSEESKGAPLKPAAPPLMANPVLADVSVGHRNAHILVVVYGSPTSLGMRSFWRDTLPEFKAKFMDNNKARLVVRNFPSPPLEAAYAAGAIVHCAGEEHYFQFLSDVYANQEKLLGPDSSGAGAIAVLADIAAQRGLPADQQRICLESTDMRAFLRERTLEASFRQRQVNAVSDGPTIFVNGEYVPVASLDAIGAVIERRLATTVPPAN